MCFLQLVQDVQFLYFGLSFYHVSVVNEVCMGKGIIPFHSLPDGCETLQKVIRNDLKLLKDAKLASKCKYLADGSFRKLSPATPYVYIYQYKKEHAACSKTLFSEIVSCVDVQLTAKALMPACTESSHQHRHRFLLPFFKDNEKTMATYNEDSSPELNADRELLKNILARPESGIGTMFEAPQSSSFGWDENDWTKRLVGGIQKMFSEIEVIYTAEMGLTWHNSMLSSIGVVGPLLKEFFLFRGAPDVLIKKKKATCTMVMSQVMSLCESEGSDDSPDVSVIEDSFQRTPRRPATSSGLPEKVGELFAGLHIILVSKFLKKLLKSKSITDKKREVKGILIDKICGVIQCTLAVKMEEGRGSTLEWKVVDYSGEILTPTCLCSHVTALLN